MYEVLGSVSSLGRLCQSSTESLVSDTGISCFSRVQDVVRSGVEPSGEPVERAHFHPVSDEREPVPQRARLRDREYAECQLWCKKIGMKTCVDTRRLSWLQERNSGDTKRYNEIILHETLRVAVCDMLEGDICNDALRYNNTASP